MILNRVLPVCIALLLCLLAAGDPVRAADEPKPVPLKEWQQTLESAEEALAAPDLTDQRLTVLRDQLLQLDEAIHRAQAAAQQQAALLKNDLESLGPAPAAGAPPEAAGVVARRKSLNAELAAAEGVGKESDLLLTRSDRALAAIKQVRRARFAERVLMRTASPLSPAFWSKLGPELAGLWADVSDAVGQFRTRHDRAPGSGTLQQALVLGIGLAVLLAFPVRTGLSRWLSRRLPAGRPSDGQRLQWALIHAVLHAGWPSLAVLVIYLSLCLGDGLGPSGQALADQGLLDIVLAFITASFSHAALRPRRPEWRLVALPDASARVISRTITGLVTLFALDDLVGLVLNQLDVGLEIYALRNLLFGGLVSLALAGLLLPRVWAVEAGRSRFRRWHPLRKWLLLLVMAIPLAALLGYSALSRLLASHLVLSLALIVGTGLLLRISDEWVTHLLGFESRIGLYLRRQLALTGDGAEMLAFWLAAALKCGVLMAGVLGLFLLWSVDKGDAWLWLKNGFHGVQLGGITVSVADGLLGLLLFAALLTATRLIQRPLDQRIFPRTRLDSGVRHSIRSAIGYGGFTLAAMTGISTMGIDLSNLAIIAGALSVGIGFGLQNMVNNFVSGLILLIERPIKAGDRVVVGEHQGYVKKISVRATELITFDRSSVFIPNSSLISGSVTNRTYADKEARLILPFSLDFEADPEQARALVEAIARAHPGLQPSPAPVVLLTGLGDNGLHMELVAGVYDVDSVKSVTSELYFALLATFREQGVRLSHPRRGGDA